MHLPNKSQVSSSLYVGMSALVLMALAPLSHATTLVVNGSRAEASDDGAGTEEQPYKTISAAAAKAMPGDTVLVHGGIYRERVAPGQGGEEGKPIIYQAAPGENVIVRGSDVWQPEWQANEHSKDVFTGTLEGFVSPDFNPFAIPMRGDVGKKTLGQVFVDGALYWEVTNDVDLLRTEGTWMAAKDGKSVSVHFFPSEMPPAKRQIEISTRNRIFAPVLRGLGYIEVRGFTFEHCSNQFPGEGFWSSDSPQAGAVSCRGGHHWVIANNTIRWATGYGLDCGTEGTFDTDHKDQPEPNVCGYHLIENNVISDNGTGGIGAYRSPFTKIIGNVIERNNYMNSNLAYEDGGIKTHFFINGVIEGNLIRDNETSGIWMDNVYQGSRVSRNLVINNKRTGIFCEMGTDSCMVDNNIVAYTRGGDDGKGAGIYTHDASEVTVAHNLLYGNATYGVYMRFMVDRPINVYPKTFKDFRDGALRSEHSACYGQKIYNNIFIANQRGAISLIYPGPLAHDNHSEDNLFVTVVPFDRQFVINQTAGGEFADLEKAYKELFSKAHIDPATKPPINKFPEGAEVDFEQWKLMMDADHKSLTVANPYITHTFNARFPELFLKVDDSPWKVRCAAVPGVTEDFFGQPIGPDKILPGPFQNLKKGKNTLALWKVSIPSESKN